MIARRRVGRCAGVRLGWLCCSLVLRRCCVLSSPVEVECEAVDAQGVGEQVEGLAQMADAVCSSEPEGVIEVTVDAFGVIATRVETVEVGVVGWDRAQVLGAVELTLLIVGVLQVRGSLSDAGPGQGTYPLTSATMCVAAEV